MYFSVERRNVTNRFLSVGIPYFSVYRTIENRSRYAIVTGIMQDSGMARRIARGVALGALFLIPFAPLIVASSFFFPFITGKAFYVRILVEVAVCAWGALACLDKAYRPRFSLIGAGVLLFVLWMGIANLFAVNAPKAFWSNFERMEGWVLLAHLLGLFFSMSSVLRVEKKWRAWFLTSLGVSGVVSLYAFLQLGDLLAIHQGSTRIDATFGNSAYLAIYFLFSACIAAWLALTEKRSWLKWILVVLATIEATLIFFTETRGTILGLVFGLALAAGLTIMTAGKRARRIAAGVLALIVLLSVGFYTARSSTFVQSNHILQRIASISLSDGETRFTLWRMALQGASERPVMGWGQEGFNYVFSKYYDPSLFAQEPWFDRAHNAFIDWLIAGGVPAFFLYIGLFGSVLSLLWGRSEFSRSERVALTVAVVGYAVHNLFVFDNLYSYVYFFALLALVDAQIARPVERIEQLPAIDAEDGMVYVLPVAAAVAIALVWSVNVPGMRVAGKLITALSPSPGGLTQNLSVFEGLAARPSFAVQEVREQIVSFAGTVAGSSSVALTDKQRALSLAVGQMQAQVAAYPLDVRERLELSYAYRLAGDSMNALKELQAALALSPKKEQMWIETGTVLWQSGDVRGAQKAFNTAYALGPQFSDLATYAAAGDIAAGDSATADTILRKVYGTTTIDSDILAIAYYHAKNWERLLDIWELRASRPTAGAQALFGLAAAQYASGDGSGAIRTLRGAVMRHPEAKASADAAIAQIQENVPLR